nr:hypothetical protein [Tanacetum cinerariifolium]
MKMEILLEPTSNKLLVVLMTLAEENDIVSKEGARNVAITDSSTTAYDSVDESLVCSIPIPPQKKLDGVEPISGPKTIKSILRSKSIFKDEALKDVTINEPSSAPTKDNKSSFASKVHSTPTVAITDSSTTAYDSVDESLVCSIPIPPQKKLDGVEPISGPKTIKSILRSKSIFKDEALKDVTINEPSSAPTKDNKSSFASKVHSTPTGKLKSMKIKDDPPLAIVMKELNNLKLQFSKNQSSHFRNDQSKHTPQNKYKT